jgi:hypothetical protein
MRQPAALFPFALALGAISLAPAAGAREPTKIKTCQTISQPGPYELADNLVATGGGNCLVIAADFVTIDLAGFMISGGPRSGTGILVPPTSGQLHGIVVRNGSISGVATGVDLRLADGSIVEGLRLAGGGGLIAAINATGIVKGNTVSEWNGAGIDATGVVTGNSVTGTIAGLEIGQGSTAIGNSVTRNSDFGIIARCPSNLTDNTAIDNGHNGTSDIAQFGDGCHIEDNLGNVIPF